MNPGTVRTEVAERLATIDGLRAHAYPPGSVSAPAAVVQPARVDFDMTYRRGMDKAELTIIVLVGKPNDRSSHARLDEYAAGDGDRSVKAVLESGTYTSLDDLVVTSVEWDVVPFGGVDYLAGIFTVAIAGSGE